MNKVVVVVWGLGREKEKNYLFSFLALASPPVTFIENKYLRSILSSKIQCQLFTALLNAHALRMRSSSFSESSSCSSSRLRGGGRGATTRTRVFSTRRDDNNKKIFVVVAHSLSSFSRSKRESGRQQQQQQL